MKKTARSNRLKAELRSYLDKDVDKRDVEKLKEKEIHQELDAMGIPHFVWERLASRHQSRRIMMWLGNAIHTMGVKMAGRYTTIDPRAIRKAAWAAKGDERLFYKYAFASMVDPPSFLMASIQSLRSKEVISLLDDIIKDPTMYADIFRRYESVDISGWPTLEELSSLEELQMDKNSIVLISRRRDIFPRDMVRELLKTKTEHGFRYENLPKDQLLKAGRAAQYDPKKFLDYKIFIARYESAKPTNGGNSVKSLIKNHKKVVRFNELIPMYDSGLLFIDLNKTDNVNLDSRFIYHARAAGERISIEKIEQFEKMVSEKCAKRSKKEDCEADAFAVVANAVSPYGRMRVPPGVSPDMPIHRMARIWLGEKPADVAPEELQTRQEKDIWLESPRKSIPEIIFEARKNKDVTTNPFYSSNIMTRLFVKWIDDKQQYRALTEKRQEADVYGDVRSYSYMDFVHLIAPEDLDAERPVSTRVFDAFLNMRRRVQKDMEERIMMHAASREPFDIAPPEWFRPFHGVTYLNSAYLLAHNGSTQSNCSVGWIQRCATGEAAIFRLVTEDGASTVRLDWNGMLNEHKGIRNGPPPQKNILLFFDLMNYWGLTGINRDNEAFYQENLVSREDFPF